MHSPIKTLFLLLLTAWLTPALYAQARPVDSEGHQWWQHAVFYEIYPRSFADSNNNGVGDLNGIASKLDYLKQLGVDAIWITPCFPSSAGGFWLRRFGLRSHRSHVRDAARLRSPDERSQEAKHADSSGLCDQPHFRSAQVVYRFEVVPPCSTPRLVCMAGWEGTGRSTE